MKLNCFSTALAVPALLLAFDGLRFRVILPCLCTRMLCYLFSPW